MFTPSLSGPSPAPSSPPNTHPSSLSSTSIPPSRSRLRSLSNFNSYLRSVTHGHILNRDQGSSPGALSTSPTATTFPTSPTSNTAPSPGTLPAQSLPRSSEAQAQAVNESTSALPAFSPLHRATTLPAPAPASISVSPLQAYRSGPHSSAASPTPTPAVASLQISSSTTPSLALNALATAAAAAAPVDMTSAATTNSVATRTRSATEPGAAPVAHSADNKPSIRFSPFHDPRSSRPSLKFTTISRTLPLGTETIRVGRYSERDTPPPGTPSTPSAAHVGFKSKVVSRRHCEFWYEDNRWYIKDVKSSSGTFLNHIRLSQPGIESKPYVVNDGDIVQLGIDFKGGEEMIFRCVKMRVELNRGWQNKLNAFNVNTHKRLRKLVRPNDDASNSTQDCAICLNSIAPCQSLFVAPCSHTWHFKCIKALLDAPRYPNFTCPNCRAAADLDADVEDPEEWEEEEAEVEASNHASPASSAAVNTPEEDSGNGDVDMASAAGASGVGDETEIIDLAMDDVDTPPVPRLSTARPIDTPTELSDDDATAPASHSTVNPVSIPAVSASTTLARRPLAAAGTPTNDSSRPTRTPSPSDQLVAPQGEGPITPRNDHGPWVFDGSGIRIGASRASTDSRQGEMHNLGHAAQEFSTQ